MGSLTKRIGYFFMINLISLTVLFSYMTVVQVKQLKLNNVIQSIDPITNCPQLSSKVDYVLICDYRPHLNLDPSITEFNEINDQTLSGVIHILNDTEASIKHLITYITICNELPDCIGFSLHPTAGIFFHNAESIPIQHVRNWQFYIKPKSITDIKQSMSLQINRVRPLNLELIQVGVEDKHTTYNIMSIPRLYLSFAWNQGGPNNQIMTLANMLKYCVIYHRTLIIPFQINEDQFIGLTKHNPMWDLNKLSEVCDYVLEEEIIDENIELLRFRYLTLQRDDFRDERLLNECDIDSRKSYGIKQYQLNGCNLIHVKNGKFGILHNHFDDIHGFYSYIIPNKYIRDAVDKKINYHFNRFASPYRIGVFRRTLKRPDDELADDITNQPYYCRAWNVGLSHSNDKWAKSIRATIENNQYLMEYNNGEIKDKLSSIYDLYDRTCAANWDDIQEILRFHRQAEINTEQREPWFLVSDWIEWKSVELKWIRKYAAITIHGTRSPDKNQLPQSEFTIAWSKNKEFAKSINASKQVVASNYLKYISYFIKDEQNEVTKWINDDWYHENEEMYWSKEKVWFNMWMLSKSDFFVSSWFSTVTQTICHWRGKMLMNKSTNCYLNQKWEQTNKELWFDINAIDSEPKLPWNNVHTRDVQ